MRITPVAGACFSVLAAADTAFAQAAQSAPAPPEPPPATENSDTGPVEVTVRGLKPPRDIGSRDVPTSTLRNVPGTFGDPFQAVASMPGVGPMASGLPYFYARGAPPADSGYFLDGIPLPTLFHIGPGPSVVPPALLDRVQFFPATAPARFGRFAGGIISADSGAPSPVARGEASLRLFDVSAFIESPLDSASTALVAGRYGYPNLLLSVFAPQLSLSYGDYTARLTRKLSAADAVSLFAIGAYDTERDESGQLLPVDTRFHRVDLRYDHTWRDGRFRVATTIGDDRTAARTFGLLSTPFSIGANDALTETSVRVRFELAQRLGSARLSAGVDANGLVDHSGSASVPPSQQVSGAFVDLEVRASERVTMVVGARVDAYQSPRGLTASADPRLAMRIRVTPNLTSITTVGIAHQPPTYLLPVPGLRLDPADGLQSAYQYAQGAEFRLPLALTATVTAFYNADRGMNDFVSDCGALAINCSVVSRVDGSTYGLEVIVQRSFSEKLSGWLSYTLSRAERNIEGLPFLSPFDRTHELSVVLRYDFGNGIDLGVRGTYYTGRPEIPSVLLQGQSLPVAFGAGGVPQYRLPDFYRIDLRAAKRWPLGGGRWLAAVAEFFDATLNREAVDFKCSIAAGRCTAEHVGPIALPSIGLEGGF
jgi:hypothetical protein